MGKLTKAQRIILQTAVDFGGEARVLPDMRTQANNLYHVGLVALGGTIKRPMITITDAGRRALEEGEG